MCTVCKVCFELGHQQMYDLGQFYGTKISFYKGTDSYKSYKPSGVDPEKSIDIKKCGFSKNKNGYPGSRYPHLRPWPCDRGPKGSLYPKFQTSGCYSSRSQPCQNDNYKVEEFRNLCDLTITYHHYRFVKFGPKNP